MKFKRMLAVLLLLLLLVTAWPLQALAAATVTAEIPFTIKNAPGTVVMEPLDGAPDPVPGQFDEVTEGTFKITFTEPGDYSYKIYQQAGTESGITYDETVYIVVISVYVKDDGSLYAVTVISKEGSDTKPDNVGFENTGSTTPPPGSTATPTPEPGISPEPSTTPGTSTSPAPGGSPEPGASPNPSRAPANGPQTGDKSQLDIWIAVMIGSLMGLIIVFLTGRKRRDKRV